MQIAAIYKTGTPQFIGSTDGMDTTAELLAGAHKARHTTLKFCCKAIRGNEVKVYMFDDAEHMIDFQMRNNDYGYSELATA